jgi:hypothetical protein
MVNLSIRQEPKRGLDLGICAALLGLAVFWVAVGFTVASLL